MFCKNCGSTLQEGAKFCSSCGTMVEEQPVYEAAMTVAPEPVPPVPVRPRKSGKKLGIVIAALAAVLAVVLVAVSVLGGAGTTVARAFAKSLGAYSAVLDRMQLPDMAAISESGRYNQKMRMWLEDGAEELNGLGIRAELSWDQSGTEAALIAAPYYEGTDLLTFQMQLKDNLLYLGSPELMAGDYLMLDTLTVGQDLAAMGVYDLEGVSFNAFRLAEALQKNGKLTGEQKKELEEAGAAFAKSLRVEENGKDDVKVNGRRLSCRMYELVIPQMAMEDYLDILEDVFRDMDLDKSLESLEDAGLDIGTEVDGSSVPDALEQLQSMVRELGDLEAELAVHKGYIVAVESEFDLYDTEYDLRIHLGGGENYADDFYFELKDEAENGITVSSEGDHTMSGGVYTDETVIMELYNGRKHELFASEISWEPRAKEDNFAVALRAEGEQIRLKGTLICTGDSLEFTVPGLDVEGVVFGIGYSLEKYKAPAITPENVHVFAEMEEADMMELAGQIVANAENWAAGIQENYSDMIAYLADVMYYMF